MLTEKEMEILEIIGKRLLVRKEELKTILREKGFDDGVIIANKLSELGYVKFVDAVGSPCYAITQDGLKALKNG